MEEDEKPQVKIRFYDNRVSAEVSRTLKTSPHVHEFMRYAFGQDSAIADDVDPVEARAVLKRQLLEESKIMEISIKACENSSAEEIAEIAQILMAVKKQMDVEKQEKNHEGLVISKPKVTTFGGVTYDS